MTSGCSILATEYAFCDGKGDKSEKTARLQKGVKKHAQSPQGKEFQTEPLSLCGLGPQNMRIGGPTWFKGRKQRKSMAEMDDWISRGRVSTTQVCNQEMY
jgi:hypothetical protein